ncbi:ribose-5-phosphate isomerase A [Striga asiatica]|uniref:Ribose-5-phosphate isomerase A n=1 Tax=Striga asiatica TaxID=4170 RepID=A0A5A7Q990_STRAF|nr:ribose-5-phosphate isomerase A [Striga asiatica]
MALSSSSTIFPLSSFSPSCHSNRKSSIYNALHMTVRSRLSDDSTLLLQAAKFTNNVFKPKMDLFRVMTAIVLVQFHEEDEVDSFVENGMVVGLGSGRASGFAIQSVDSASEAAKAGVPLAEYRDSSKPTPTCLGLKGYVVVVVVELDLKQELMNLVLILDMLKLHQIIIMCILIDIAFIDADVIEEESLVAVIGRKKLLGGESIIQEKAILRAAGKLVLICTAKQYQGVVDGSIPVLINSVNWLETAEEIDDLFLGDAEVWRRPAVGYAGPLGGDFPLVTREGHNVLDVIFTSPIQNLGEVADSLDQVAGVIEHGVISRIPCTAVIAKENGMRVFRNSLMNEGSKVL